MKIKKKLQNLLLTSALLAWQPLLANEDYFSMSIEELLSISVVSASRSPTSITEAPSAMTVITADDISRQGLKTLEEVLQRVPGFFPTDTNTRAIISNRGILTGNFLLLFDGHSVNSIVKNGLYNQHIFPLLDTIQRIEIVRGPGSTLWGSDAALGVINVITKSDFDPDGSVRASYDYADNIKRHIAKLSYNKGFGKNSGLMITGNLFTSDTPWINNYRAGTASQDSFTIPRGTPSTFRDFDDSYEVYAKLKLDSLQLSARLLRVENMADFLSNTGIPERYGHFEYENDFVEAKYNTPVGDSSDIEFRAYYDRIYDHAIGDKNAGQPTRYIRSEEEGLGSELIYTTTHFEDHKIKIGAKYRYVDVKRLDERTFSEEGMLIKQTDLSESGIDQTIAVFAEDTWNFADKWIAVLGGRVDYNDFREDETVFLPRAALIYKATDRFTFKYLYNTGYIRPNVEQSHGTAGEPFKTANGTYWVGASKSENVASHDFQILYNYENVYFGTTFYYLTYDNYIEWPGVQFQTDPDYLATFQNIGQITSKGVELDFKAKISAPLTLYGNYSYNHSRLDSLDITVQGVPVDLRGSYFVESGGALTGVPEQTWNLGVDYRIVKDLDLNTHYRGWDGIWTQETKLPKYKKFGPQHYVDLNLRWKNISNMFDASLYCKNLFDTGSIPDTMLSGTPIPVSSGTNISGVPTPTGIVAGYGRIVGFNLAMEF